MKTQRADCRKRTAVNLLLLRRLVLQVIASLPDTAGINGLGALLDVLDNSVLVHQEGGSNRQALGRIEDAVLLADCSLEVAEQRESDAKIFGETLVAGGGINADAQNLNVVSFVMCDISLIRP